MAQASQPKLDSGKEAMELAESSRQTEWHHPSFVAELFAGNFRSDLIVPFFEQDPVDKAEGDRFIDAFEKFLKEKVDADEIDRTGQIPDTVVQGLKSLKAFGMKIDKEYGGLGFSQTNYARALAVVGGHCSATVAWLSAHQSIGAPQPLKMFGTPEQKKKWMPKLVTSVSAFALTEPGVGSDPANMETMATPIEDGRFYLINGRKLWCTNGAIADIIIVMARTPDIIVRGKPKKQITAFLVERSMPGFKVIHRCEFMGIKGIQNALIEFKDVRVPSGNIVGEVGEGLKLALMTLNTGRLSLPAACVGLGKKCLEIQRYWTVERTQWGKKIGHHEEVAAKTALIAAGTFAMEAMTYWTSGVVDRGGYDIRLEAAIAKLFCTELAWKIAYETLQTRGGRGFERAESLKARGERPIPIERMMRDIRINTILEGSTEIMHLFTAREALDTHMRLLMGVIAPHLTLGQRIRGAMKMMGFYALWYPRQWLYWGRWPLYSDMGPKLAGHFRYVSRTSHRLARTIFHVMAFYQLDLQNKQLILSRVVEIGSELFAMAAACSRAKLLTDKNPSDSTPRELADLFCVDARKRIDNHFRSIWCNSDRQQMKVSKAVMDGRYEWLEKGTIRGNF